jgi:hypothetical protein
MNPLIVSGLSSIGVSLLDQTLGRIRNIEPYSLNFNAILNRLSRKGCAKVTLDNMKTELLEAIHTNPLLNEFRNQPDSLLSISLDPHGRCTFRENGQIILTCSRESSLGKLGVAFFNLSQISLPNNQPLTEVYLENVA